MVSFATDLYFAKIYRLLHHNLLSILHFWRNSHITLDLMGSGVQMSLLPMSSWLSHGEWSSALLRTLPCRLPSDPLRVQHTSTELTSSRSKNLTTNRWSSDLPQMTMSRRPAQSAFPTKTRHPSMTSRMMMMMNLGMSLFLNNRRIPIIGLEIEHCGIPRCSWSMPRGTTSSAHR